ncbi:uncharacterized protein LOC124662682 [Lolium rigidum]|uniref:uncharacterized protein LOC124662682 n=1 Tax=Lolium rigidum TaxID=89674 RepID=UPI001F5CFD46|nr:uncharacterized protein LOC124662682 [Lolium rigidum]
MASTSPPMATSNQVASRLMEIPDHLLSEILLRLPAPEDLARASAACVSFRRLVTDQSFLRSFRRLHPQPLLGFLDHEGFYPAQPPHPSAPAAHALAHAADFSFSFMPSRCRWAVRTSATAVEVAVCDPLHRRYVLLPPLPQDLAASVEHFRRGTRGGIQSDLRGTFQHQGGGLRLLVRHRTVASRCIQEL